MEMDVCTKSLYCNIVCTCFVCDPTRNPLWEISISHNSFENSRKLDCLYKKHC